MAVSQKQLKANKKNAQQGGVKTSEGKEIVKYNALKHGLLAKEAVVTVGDGAENPEEFNAHLRNLETQFQPQGHLETMLVERIAIAYWRLRRACRYETGLIRQKLDTATENFYSRTSLGTNINKTDEEIDQEIQQNEDEIKTWREYSGQLNAMQKNGTSLEATFDLDELWDWLYDKEESVLSNMQNYETEIGTTKELREFLNNNLSWSDQDIWEALIEVCEEKIVEYTDEIADLGKQKKQNKLKLQVIKKLGCIPSKEELDRLLRYEGAIEKQLYKAINQLERAQRLRSGDNVPAPVEVDVNVNTDQLA